MSNFEHIAYAARTDVGKKRKNNEDAFGTFPDAGVFCVADGMGGGDDGEIASAAVIKGVEDAAKLCASPTEGGYAAADVAEVLETGLSKASEWMFNRSAEKRLSGCGSTFVGVVLDATRPDAALALHAGDSRLYLLHGRSIKQITRDHSAAEMMGAKDESKINPIFRSMVVNAVGIKPNVEVETTPFKVAAGDRILICSDGLSKMIPDKRIASVSRKHEDIGEAADALIAAALEAGGVDNVTVVLVEIGDLPEAVSAQPLPEAASGFVDEEKGTCGETDSTDAPTDDPDFSTDTESRTMQTVQPTVMRAKFTVRKKTTAAKTGVDRRMMLILGGVVGCVILLLVVLAMWPHKTAAVGEGAKLESPDNAATNSAVHAERVKKDQSALEVLLAQTVVKTSSVDVAAGAAPSNSVVDAASSSLSSASQGKPSVPKTHDASAAVDSGKAERFAAVCASDKVKRLLSGIRGLFPNAKPSFEYREQSSRFENAARRCAGSKSPKDVENAAVELRIMLLAAVEAKESMSARKKSSAERRWLSDWEKIESGGAGDPSVQEACIRFIVAAEGIFAP